jgi:YVTN family beta-propeller protein/VCBS repeat-containing protein
LAVSPITGQVYVANRISNNVSVISTTNNTYSVVKTISGFSQPSSVAVSTDGSRVHVVNTGNATVSVIDTNTGQLVDTKPNLPGTQSISVGSSPSSVALSPDGSLAYVANGLDTISVIDTKTNTVVRTVAIDPNAPETGGHVIAVSGTHIYVTDAYDRKVRTLSLVHVNTAPQRDPNAINDPQTDETTGAVTDSLHADDIDGDKLTYSVTRAPTTGAVTVDAMGTYTYTPSQTGRDIAAQTQGPDFNSFQVTASDGQGIYNRVIDVQISPTPLASQNPVDTTAISVGSHPIDMTFAGNHLFVVNSGDGSVSVIDTTTNQVVNTIPGLGYSAPMVASADGRYLYLSQYDSSNVTASVKVVDTATRSVVATVIMPKCETPECGLPGAGWANSAGITDIAISPDDTRVYVSELWVGDSFYGGTVTMIDTATNTVVASTSNSQYGDFYSNIEVTPDGTRPYAGSGYPYYPQMDVFDARTLAGIGTVPLEGNPGWPPPSMGSLTFSPNGERAYARMTEIWPTYTSQIFAVIDTKPGSSTYNTQIATITVPAGAQYLKVSADNTRAYVVHDGGHTVTVIDTATNTVIGSIASGQIGGDYAALAVGPNGTLYFTNYANNAVYAVTLLDSATVV